MNTGDDGLNKLMELAQTKSTDKRRALLREITDLFLTRDDMREGAALSHVDDILTTAAGQLEHEDRRAMAERLSSSAVLPRNLARTLLQEPIDVAEPLLTRENGVSEEDQRWVASEGAPPHIRSLATRPNISEGVTDAILERQDDIATRGVATNQTAAISRQGFERLLHAAQDDAELHEPLVRRDDTPADLLNEMYFFVESDLRRDILDRNDKLSVEDIEHAAKAARERLARMIHVKPQDAKDALRFVESRKLRKSLTPDLLLTLLQNSEHAKFYAAFAALAELSIPAARFLTEKPNTAPFASACRAAGFETAVFVPLAILRPTQGERGDADPNALAEIYETLPREDAQRIMRFWRVRQSLQKGEGDEAAA